MVLLGIYVHCLTWKQKCDILSSPVIYALELLLCNCLILRKQNWNFGGGGFAVLINFVAYGKSVSAVRFNIQLGLKIVFSFLITHQCTLPQCCSTVWVQISVEELENSISVKISKEAVMSINNPGDLFMPLNGKLEAKVYIAGLPSRTNSIIKQVFLSSPCMQTLPEYYTIIYKLYLTVPGL